MVDQPDVHRAAIVIDSGHSTRRVGLGFTPAVLRLPRRISFLTILRAVGQRRIQIFREPTVPSAAEEFFGSNKSCQLRQSVSIKTMVGKPATFLALLLVLHNYEIDSDSADYRPTTVVPQPVGGSSRRVTSSP